jgi:serine/threonine protein kinase
MAVSRARRPAIPEAAFAWPLSPAEIYPPVSADTSPTMPPVAPQVNAGDLIAGKYRVEGVLGRGGMGIVIAARHEQLGNPVAIKLMLPAGSGGEVATERFVREARAAARLRGEHIARLMDFGTLESGAPYIVMEFLEGSDFGRILKTRGRLPAVEAVDYVLQVCKAMDEAHAKGIIHRDLKPQNLFLTHRPDGTPLVKVLDFGISKLAGDDGSMTMTGSMMILGSPSYMAPEQVQSASDADQRADIYSLGVILYQLTSGVLPITAKSIGELVAQTLTKPLPPLRERAPEIEPELEAVVMRCLEKNPEDRFQSVRELSVALAPFLDFDRVGSPVLGSTTLGTTTYPPSRSREAPKSAPPRTFRTMPSVASTPDPSRGGIGARERPRASGLTMTVAGMLALVLGGLLAWGHARWSSEASPLAHTPAVAGVLVASAQSTPSAAFPPSASAQSTTASASAAARVELRNAEPPSSGRAPLAPSTARPRAPPGPHVRPSFPSQPPADPFSNPD